MSLVNSLAIGDADPATLVKGQDQTPVSSTVQNKKLFINLKSFDNAGGQLTRLFGGRVCPCRLKQLQALGIERVAVSSCKIHRPNLTIGWRRQSSVPRSALPFFQAASPSQKANSQR
jgi:hypothetical protein